MKKNIVTLFIFLLSLSQLMAQKNNNYEKAKFNIINTVRDTLIKISPHTYAIIARAGAGNILIYEGKDGFILVDDQWEDVKPTIDKILKSISDKPVLFVLNTHFHFDHTDGNMAFGKQGIKIIAHDNLRKRLLTEQHVAPPTDVYQKAYPFNALPSITFSDSLTLHEEMEAIKIYHVVNAHTDTDSFIQFQHENVFHTGDVFVRYGFPYIDTNSGGNIVGIIKAVNDLIARTNDSSQIIPGHGPISSRKDLITYRDNLQLIVDRIKDGMAKNLTVQQIEQNNPVKDIKWWNGMFVTSSVYNMIKEAK